MKRSDIKMKYSDIINPKYEYFKLVPSSGINSYDSSNLSLIANQLFKTLFARIHFIERQIFKEEKTSIRYIIDISKESVNFYYIIPKNYKQIAIDTIAKTWNGKCIVQEVHKKSIRVLENPTIYQMKYKYQDFLSLKTNASSNKFLYKALSILEIMKDGDNVQLAINLLPSKQSNHNWKTYCDDIYNRFQKNLPIEKNKFDLDYILNLLKASVGDILELILPDALRTKVEHKVPGSKDGLSTATINKAKNVENIVDTQIAVLTKSNDKFYEEILAKSFCSSFSELNGDNKLIPYKVRTKNHNVSHLNSEWNIDIQKLSVQELSSLISIAGQNILKKFKCIEHLATKQVDVVPELLEGISVLGVQNHSFHKIKYIYYLNEYEDFAYLPILILTKMGGGKSSWLENVGVSIMNDYKSSKNKKKKESLFCIDFIKQNELSYNIMYNLDPEDIILIDLTTPEGVKKLGFHFKEALSEINTPREIINFASLQGDEMMKLINALNVGITEPLTGPMCRYLSCAFQICYIHDNKTLKDALDIIQDYEIRHKYIEMIPENMKESLNYEVKTLLELDTDDHDTKHNLVSGIITRAHKLMGNPTLREMYEARPEDSVDLLDALQSGKAIFVTMPDNLFNRDIINVISTYVISRLFFVCKRRGELSKNKLTRCTLLIDEINLAPGCLKTLDEMIGQLRKYKLRTIISAHNFSQLKDLKENLNTMGLSLVLPQGSHKSNFYEFENEFKQNGFYLDDLSSLKKHETLNLIETSDGKKAFISKFPKPVPGKIEDRNDIELHEFKEIVRKRLSNVENKKKNNSKPNLSLLKNFNKNTNIEAPNQNTNFKTNEVEVIDINTKKEKHNKSNSNLNNLNNLNDDKFNDLFKNKEFIEENDDVFNL